MPWIQQEFLIWTMVEVLTSANEYIIQNGNDYLFMSYLHVTFVSIGVSTMLANEHNPVMMKPNQSGQLGQKLWPIRI